MCQVVGTNCLADDDEALMLKEKNTAHEEEKEAMKGRNLCDNFYNQL